MHYTVILLDHYAGVSAVQESVRRVNLDFPDCVVEMKAPELCEIPQRIGVPLIGHEHAFIIESRAAAHRLHALGSMLNCYPRIN